jgi:hypothetical protein
MLMRAYYRPNGRTELEVADKYGNVLARLPIAFTADVPADAALRKLRLKRVGLWSDIGVGREVGVKFVTK